MFFMDMLDIRFTPFVSSTNPEVNGFASFRSKPRSCKTGEKILLKLSNKLVLSNIEIITEKITTNPPIIRIVETAF